MKTFPLDWMTHNLSMMMMMMIMMTMMIMSELHCHLVLQYNTSETKLHSVSSTGAPQGQEPINPSAPVCFLNAVTSSAVSNYIMVLSSGCCGITSLQCSWIKHNELLRTQRTHGSAAERWGQCSNRWWWCHCASPIFPHKWQQWFCALFHPGKRQGVTLPTFHT